MTTTLDAPQERRRGRAQRFAIMFTDIEGSTTLLQELGDAYGPALRRHQDILRARIEAHDGQEQGTQGDSFFVLFGNPRDALAAAVSIHRDLAAETWPRDARLRVRIGLHDGFVARIDSQCVGLDVHLTARIANAAHGGQTLLSRSAYEALEPSAFTSLNVQARPLGAHRLKDMRYPETLFDIVDAESGESFPPIRSVGARRTNIANPRGPIIGRDREITEVQGLLDRHPGRLITIVGAGGTGKTSVAERVATLSFDEYPDGTFMVDASGVDEPGLLFPMLAEAMGVRDYPGRPIELDIAASIGSGSVLLILDTFEHVMAAAVSVGDLLSECPNLRILVTSRAPLDLPVEQTYPLSPLDVPSPDDPAPETSGAMQMFVETVREDIPDFTVDASNRAAIAAIVRKLEGIPLALNLAAARMSLLPPDKLLERLDAQLNLLRGKRKETGRHRTLRDAIEWSDGLLDADERDVFQRLSVFAGGFRLDDAEGVLDACGDCDADVLDAVASLVDKNLLHRRLVNGVPRFGMYDMIREYALESLAERGATDTMERAYVEQFCRFAEQAGAMAMHEDQRRHVIRLIEEADNVRAVLRHAIDSGDIVTAARMIHALYWYWISQGQFTESLRWIEQASVLAQTIDEAEAAAKINLAAAYTKATAGDYAGAYPHGRDAERLFAQVQDADATQQAALIHAICGAAAGVIEDPTEQVTGAVGYMEAQGDHYFTAIGYIIMGEGARLEGDRAAAEECYNHALTLFSKVRNTFWPGLLKQNIGHFRLAQNQPEAALAIFAEAYDLGEIYDYRMVMTLCVAGFGGAALARGDAETAARFLGAVTHNMDKTGASFEPTDEADIAGYIERTRAALGEAEYDRCAADGAAALWADIRAEARATARAD